MQTLTLFHEHILVAVFHLAIHEDMHHSQHFIEVVGAKLFLHVVCRVEAYVFQQIVQLLITSSLHQK